MALVALNGEQAARFQRVNAAMCRITGYSESELIGANFRIINQSEREDETTAVLKRMADGELDRWEAEKQFRHIGGGERWVHIFASVARDPDGSATHCIFQVIDISARKHAEAQLTHHALHDPLTGLPNRTLLVANLAQAIERAGRRRGHVAVLFIDLDDFKLVNDSLGHDAGDEILVEVARRLSGAMRGADMVARLGGDEFVVVCEDLRDAAETAAVVERVGRSLHAPVTLSGRSSNVRASIGVAISTISPTPEALLRDADAAMYRAKGRVGLKERTRIECQRAQALADMEQAQRLARVGSWTWDPALEIATWSPQMFEIYARNPNLGPACQTEALAYVHCEDRDTVSATLARAFSSGAELELEHRIIAGDGAQRTVRLVGRSDPDHAGRYIGTFQDITERRRVEQTTAHLAAIVQSSDDAIIGKTLQGRITSWNPAAERMYGYAATDAVGQHISLLGPSRRQRREIASILGRLAGGESIDHFETKRRCKDGREIDVALTISPIRNGSGEVVGASSVARDITERKRSADALVYAEERFRGAFEQAPIGMALLEVDMRIAKVNEALCRITGHSTDRLERMTLQEIVDPDDAGAALEALASIRAGQLALHTSEQRFVHALGHSIWVALQLTLIRGRDGQPLRFIAQAQDISARKRFEDRLQDLTDHDVLTGALNRQSLTRALEVRAASVRRGEAEGALLLLDLDHFKYVNDSLGHRAGDQIIRRIASLIAPRLGPDAVLARLDGDEFAVLLPSADQSAACSVAVDLLSMLSDPANTALEPAAGRITASVGIETFRASLTGEEVLVNAELAMYDAKNAGRNQAAIYHSDDSDQGLMTGQMKGVRQIRAALQQDRFTLLAQPIIDYRTGAVAAHELLIRVRDEHGGLLPPGSLLSIAERLDLIQEIDTWVIGQAFGLLADSTISGDELPLHVNISGRSVGEATLLELIENELRRTRIEPSRVILEITETAAVRQITQALRFAERLNELGCRLALDDFGTGFGTFYYLKHLPFEFLKIDGEFIRNCRQDTSDRIVIEALVAIAHGLGKRTIAEYVEDRETAQLLTDLGVDYGQGNHHGRPAPTAERQLLRSIL